MSRFYSTRVTLNVKIVT